MRAAARRRRAFIYLALSLLYLVILLFPVYWMAMMMVKPADLMFVRPTEWAFSPTLSHFEYVVEHGFLGNLGTSLIVSIGSTLLVVVIGTPAAYAFARFKIWRRDDLFLFILATRMAPPVALAIPFYLIYAKLDILDTHLGLIVVYLTFNLSFYVWVLCSFCRDLPVELEEAALADGYSRAHVLYKIVLPLLRPGIVATSVLCFIFAWNEFLYAFLARRPLRQDAAGGDSDADHGSGRAVGRTCGGRRHRDRSGVRRRLLPAATHHPRAHPGRGQGLRRVDGYQEG